MAGYDKCSFGTTLVFWNQADADKWEPQAASIADRVDAIRQAHDLGIKTWVSLEPVIDPDQALTIIRALHPIVDHWKSGKINHNREVEHSVDWRTFKGQLLELLDGFEVDYYLKNSLRYV